MVPSRLGSAKERAADRQTVSISRAGFANWMEERYARLDSMEGWRIGRPSARCIIWRHSCRLYDVGDQTLIDRSCSRCPASALGYRCDSGTSAVPAAVAGTLVRFHVF